MSGESEQKLRQLFSDALEAAPSVIFIDEIDSLAPKRSRPPRRDGEEDRRAAPVLHGRPGLPSRRTRQGGHGRGEPPEGRAGGLRGPARHVVVIGATNRPDSIDPALRRSGRFDREVCVGIPDEAARASILRVVTRALRLDGLVDVGHLARKTPGYVAADLRALAKEAAASAISRSFADLAKAGDAAGEVERLPAESLVALAVKKEDFDAALKCVQPSIQREGFATVPGVTWADVGALSEIKDELHFAITLPIQQPERFKALGLNATTGVLLYGPPAAARLWWPRPSPMTAVPTSSPSRARSCSASTLASRRGP